MKPLQELEDFKKQYGGTDLVSPFENLDKFFEQLKVKLPALPIRVLDDDCLKVYGGPREMLEDVINGRTDRVLLAGCRGGGKTFTSALTEFIMWKYKKYDWINAGGTLDQANKAYEALKSFIAISSEPVQKFTKKQCISKNGKDKIAIYNVRARGPHVGNIIKGGGLSLDEEAEAPEEAVNQAMNFVSSAKNSVIMRLSTFHKTGGTFNAIWDEADARGYRRYFADIFDMSERCPYKCIDCFPEFKEDTYVTGKDGIQRLIKKAYCAGRAKETDGHITIKTIMQLYKDITDTTSFERELLGWRLASVSNRSVIFDRYMLEKKCIINKLPSQDQMDLSDTIMGIDWADSGQNAIFILGVNKGRTKAYTLFIEYLDDASEGEIYNVINDLYKQFSPYRVKADISHQSRNRTLREVFGIPVEDVPFKGNKEFLVSLLNRLIEREQILFPKGDKFDLFLHQLRTWRRDSMGEIIKKNDHGPDALLFALFDELFDFKPVGYFDRKNRIKKAAALPDIIIPEDPTSKEAKWIKELVEFRNQQWSERMREMGAIL